MKKIRVLHVIAGMDRGGAETFLMNVFRNIDREKFDFTFLCYGNNKFDYENEIEQLGGHIERIDLPKKIGIRKHLQQLIDVIKEGDFEVVHSHTYYNSGISMLAAYICKTKLRITHSHNTKSEAKSSFVKKIYNLISKLFILLFSNQFLACTEEAGKSLFGNKEFKIIRNGIELENFLYVDNSRKKIRKELNIDESKILIGNIGRLEEQKNHSFLIDVMSELVKINNNYELVIIGRGSLEYKLKEKVKEKNIQNHVHFLGVKDNVNELYSAFDLFVFPSLFEGLGIVLIEAQVNGLKCIVSNSVPKDVNISKKVKFINLKEDAIQWANEIANTNIQRNMDMSFIDNSDYDIKNTVHELQKIYYKR